MKAPELLAAALVFSWAAGVSAGGAFGQPAQKLSADKENKGLIRKDLLLVQRGEVGVPKRNIFAPQSSSRIPVQSAPDATPIPRPGQGEEQNVAPGQEAQAPPALSINLRYIGFIEYVKSSKKLTALIILEGQAIAVEEGEVVGEGVRIGKITPKELEVIMPDATTKKFSLELEGE
jgi:hypothetical protein